MTTAGRPTFDTARGGRGKWESDLSAMSKQYSARDMPAHLRLKSRQEGQNSASEVRNRDFRRELEERESRAAQEREQRGSRSSSGAIQSGHEKRERGSRGGAEYSSSSKKAKLDAIPANVDVDDPLEEDYEDEDDPNDDSDDEEETAELMAELARIKKERAAETVRLETERRAEEERIRTENILKGNPLMNQQTQATSAGNSADFKVKRRWDDDVVFKNCSRGEVDKTKRGFINDTLRSEFHKKFMEKYIQ